MKNGNGSHIEFMSMVAKDIILHNPYKSKQGHKDYTWAQAMAVFYKIMRKYGIKQGTWEGNGRICANFEWTMCLTLFKEIHYSNMNFYDMFNEKMPKDLLAYGKKPRIKM